MDIKKDDIAEIYSLPIDFESLGVSFVNLNEIFFELEYNRESQTILLNFLDYKFLVKRFDADGEKVKKNNTTRNNFRKKLIEKLFDNVGEHISQADFGRDCANRFDVEIKNGFLPLPYSFVQKFFKENPKQDGATFIKKFPITELIDKSQETQSLLKVELSKEKRNPETYEIEIYLIQENKNIFEVNSFFTEYKDGFERSVSQNITKDNGLAKKFLKGSSKVNLQISIHFDKYS